jgi:phage baseplate assembly protein W|tara:strand:- start:44585 stop:45022 length:438 start_codon:yes stop_codon:yes gene_type:complete
MANIYNKKTVAVNKASVGDQTSSTFTYKGFSSQKPKEGFKLYDIDLVKQDLINHFYIKKGEKLQNPEFGTIIWDMIFEPFTEETKKLIADDVETIVNYDPRVVVNEVSIDSTEMGMRIEASVTYLPFNVSDSMSFNFDRTTSTIK